MMKIFRVKRHKALMLSFFVLMFLALAVFPASGASAKQKTFASAEEAVTAFIDAMKGDDKKELLAIFGPAMSELSSGDEVSDRADREWFIRAYEEKNSLEKKGDDMAVLQVGNDDWPLPIPIVKKGPGWFFDTRAGKEEMISRRIGRNELRVIDTMQAYVRAQREYAGKDRDGDGVYHYARKFMSTPGKKDGLYWEAREGEEESPAGRFVAEAAQEGYTKKAMKDKQSPYHGYYFRILTGQGKHATGGAYDYVVKGNMILGFGLIAYPAKYGHSGIMSFIVNQEGIVYEKDLGRQTIKAAAAIKKYDPDKTWERVEQTAGE